MSIYKFLSILLFAFVLTACGGGGGGSKATNETSGGDATPSGTTSSGGGYSITVDKSSLTFDINLGATSSSQMVNVNYKGDGVVVGYPLGTSDPGWLSIQTVTDNPGRASFSISVTGFAPAGKATTTLRFVTGKSDGTVTKYVDIPVTVNVTKQFSVVSSGSLFFSATQDDSNSVSPSNGSSLTIVGDFPNWTITSDATWVKFSSKSGSGDAVIGVTVDPAGMPVGTANANVTITDSKTNKSFQFTVILEIRKVFSVISSGSIDFLATELDTQSVQPSSGFNINVFGYMPVWSISTFNANWLKFSKQGGTGESSVSVTADVSGLAAGTYSGSISFIDYLSFKTVTFPVTLDLRKRFFAMADTTSFTAMHNEPSSVQPSNLAQTIFISGDNPSWTISTNKSWVKLTKTSGTGDANVFYVIDPTGVDFGSNSAIVTVTDTKTNKSFNLPMTLSISHGDPVVSLLNYSTTINTKTTLQDLIIPFSVSDQHKGLDSADYYTWVLKSIDSPWVILDKNAGTSLVGGSPSAVIDVNKIKDIENGSHKALITITLSGANFSSLDFTFTLDMTMSLPKINYVAPYIATENKAGSGYLRGEAFDQTNPLQVMIENNQAPSSIPDDITQIRFTYPALAAGSYSIEIKNNLNIKRSKSNLVVLPIASFTSYSIDVSSHRTKLLFDNERHVLYAVNRVDQQLERYQYINGIWTSLSPFVKVTLQDAEFTPNGKQLAVINNSALSLIELSGNSFFDVQKTSIPVNDSCGSHFNQIGAINDGHLIASELYASCYGSAWWINYDLVSGTTDFFTYFYEGVFSVSGDGSTLYGSSIMKGGTPELIRIYDSQSKSFSNGLVYGDANYITLGNDASKVIINNKSVYSKKLDLLGYVPEGKALVSRDSSKAYVYLDGGNQPRIEIYDLNGSLQSGAIYPKITTLNLNNPILSQQGNFADVAMTETADGKTLFVSGDLRILIVPLP